MPRLTGSHTQILVDGPNRLGITLVVNVFASPVQGEGSWYMMIKLVNHLRSPRGGLNTLDHIQWTASYMNRGLAMDACTLVTENLDRQAVYDTDWNVIVDAIERALLTRPEHFEGYTHRSDGGGFPIAIGDRDIWSFSYPGISARMTHTITPASQHYDPVTFRQTNIPERRFWTLKQRMLNDNGTWQDLEPIEFDVAREATDMWNSLRERYRDRVLPSALINDRYSEEHLAID